MGGTYFAYATNSVAGNIQIIESTDLTNWNPVGNALPKSSRLGHPRCHLGACRRPDRGRLSSSTTRPRWRAREGARSASRWLPPPSPRGHSSIIPSGPLACQPSLGGSLDPSPFIDTDGDIYLVWKSNGGTGPATIWSEQLDPAGTAFLPMRRHRSCSYPVNHGSREWSRLPIS